MKLSRGVTGYIYHTVPIVLYAWLSFPTDFRRAVEEVIASDDTKIEWSVSLANRKAAALQIWKDQKHGGTLSRAPNPHPRNDGLDRKKLVITAAGSRHGFWDARPGAFGRHRVCEAESEGEDR